MRVLVTGHHGYIGSVLAQHLRQAGHEVVGLDTFYYRGCDLFDTEASVDVVEMDLRDVRADHLGGFDAVVHLAALSNDPVGDLDPDLTAEINLEGTMSLARAAKTAGVGRFVFASSCSMYGASSGAGRVDENAPLRPLTAYAASKIEAERGLWQLNDESFAPISMRNATAYGISPRLRLDVVVNNLVAWAYTTGSIRLLSDGSAWRPLVHVGDIAGATLALLEAETETVAGQAFNIGTNEENYRIRDVAEIVRARLPECKVTYADDVSVDPRSYTVDFSKFRDACPAFTFSWDVKKGVDELVTTFESVSLSRAAVEGDRFMRVRRLGQLLAVGALDADLRWSGQRA